MILDIFLYVGLLIVVLCCISLARASRSLAPFVPTRKKDVARILKLVHLKRGDVFMELGCGNGRVSMYMHDHTDATIIGIEKAWPLAYITRLRVWFHKKRRMSVVHDDVCNISLRNVHTIFVFGMQKSLKQKLAHKIISECTSGTIVLSYVFPIEPLTPLMIDRPTTNDLPIYMYRIGV